VQDALGRASGAGRRTGTRPALLPGAAAAALALAATSGWPAAADAEASVALAAVAELHPTAGNEASGTVRFVQTAAGVRIASDVGGLPPGGHGYHVHVYGDCTAPDASSAGTHFNFAGPSDPPPDGVQRITGNLGDLEADSDGRARAEREVDLATLHGPRSIVGRSVVVHARPNDPASPPIGAAGPRIACGVIGLAPPPAGGGGEEEPG